MRTQPHQGSGRSIMEKAILTALLFLLLAMFQPSPPTRHLQATKSARPGGGNRQDDAQSNSIQVSKPSPNPGPGLLSSNMQFCRSLQEVPSWAVRYGREFWRSEGKKHTLNPAAAVVLKDFPTLDLEDVIERVSHAFSPGESGTTAKARSITYAVNFDGEALHFSPSAPDALDNFERDGGPEIQARFMTTSIRFGDKVLFDSRRALPVSTVLGNVVQLSLEPKGGLVEHFEALEEGLAVTWIVNRPLAGNLSVDPSADLQRDLVVETELSGLIYAGQTTTGHHFADADGTARLVVGNAQVVDSSARRWHVPVTADENRLRITVPAAILTQAEYPIAIDPVIGPEFGVDNPILSPTTFPEIKPAISSNGRTYFVVWATPGEVVENSGVPAIDACRITETGVILDPQGIGITPRIRTGLSQFTLRAASDGTDYLVVWQELRGTTNVIAAARVSSEGVLLDTNSIVLRQQTSQLSVPSVAGQSNGYLVAWQDQRNGPGANDIYGVRVSRTGAVLDADSIPISRNSIVKFSPAVAASDGEFMVVWYNVPIVVSSNSAPSGIYGTRVSSTGEVLDADGIAISSPTSSGVPAISAIGPDYFVVWGDTSKVIRGVRVNHDGSVLDTNSLVLGSAEVPRAPLVAASGGQYLVVWVGGFGTNLGTIFGNLVTASGTVLLTNGFEISPAATSAFPVVAGNGSNFFVVWQGLRELYGFRGNILGTPVNFSGEVLNPQGILIGSSIANRELAPSVAFDGTNYLAIWSDARNNTFGKINYDIYGARIAWDGSLLDPNGIAICKAKNNQSSAVVAGSAGMFLAVWKDERYGMYGTPGDIFGARITDSGTVLDTNGIAICTLPTIQDFPAIASGSNDFFVVWVNQSDLFGTRIGTDGIVAIHNGKSLIRSDAPSGVAYPALAFNGSEYLVVWSEVPDINNTGYDILGLRVGSLGTPIDPAPITISSRPGYQPHAAVASNGTDFLAAWVDYASSTFDIFAARVAASGTVLDPNGSSVESNSSAAFPAIASDGTNYLLIWQDQFDIRGTRISSNGQSLDNPVLAIDANPSRQQLPALAYGGSEVFLAVNQGTLFSTPRAVGQLVTLGTLLPTNHPPIAVALISPIFSILPSDTNLYVLSQDGVSASVIFNASQSYDADNQSLQFAWYVDGQTNFVSTGVSFTNVLSVGIHTLELVVSDAMAVGKTKMTFEIISAAAATAQLLILVNDTDMVANSRRPLLATIAAALASFESGNALAAIKQLNAFQNKVRAQIAPYNPALASRYSTAAALLSLTQSH